MRKRTRTLHAEAERAGIVRDILCGRASVEGYALYLRNLLPAYQALEDGLVRNRDKAWVRAMSPPAVFRAGALGADLAALSGPAWTESLPLLPAGTRYARQVEAAAAGDATRLIAHAYTRYLGDLNGGQVLRRILSRTLGLPPAALAFYDFPQIPDRDAFVTAYRDAIDRAGEEAARAEVVIDEAAVAFRLNIALSRAVHDAAAAPSPAAARRLGGAG